MDSTVKVALYALREFLKLRDDWRRLEKECRIRKYRRLYRRNALRRYAQGIVIHDRLLTRKHTKAVIIGAIERWRPHSQI